MRIIKWTRLKDYNALQVARYFTHDCVLPCISNPFNSQWQSQLMCLLASAELPSFIKVQVTFRATSWRQNVIWYFRKSVVTILNDKRWIPEMFMLFHVWYFVKNVSLSYNCKESKINVLNCLSCLQNFQEHNLRPKKWFIGCCPGLSKCPSSEIFSTATQMFLPIPMLYCWQDLFFREGYFTPSITA